MEYKSPELAILALIAFVAWSSDFWNIFKRAQLYIPSAQKGGGVIKRLFVFCIGAIGWGFLIYASTAPRLPQSYVPSSVEVNDIFLVVDVSRSMLAQDFRPNRLEAAKNRIRDFVSLNPSDRLGIIMFSEKAFTLLPLTVDLKLIEQMISEIKISGLLGSGTAIGDAVGLAVGRAIRSEAARKVIVLMTDGVNNVGSLDPIQSAEMAKEENIKIYTIGIGGDPNANLPGYRIIPGGSIDLKTLKEMSRLTGGKSYVAKDEESLKDVLDEIDSLEKTKIKVSSQVVYKELFYKYLVLGAFFLLLHELSRRFFLREVA